MRHTLIALDAVRARLASFPMRSRVRTTIRTAIRTTIHRALSPRGWWADGGARMVFSALLVASAYYVGALIGLSVRFQSSPISPIWPPNTFLLVALLMVPARRWWVCLLAVLCAHLLVELPSGVPFVTASGLYVTNVGEAVIGAVGVLSLAGRPPWLGSLRKVAIYLVCAVLVAPVLTSFADAAVILLTRWGDTHDYWQLWTTRCVSNVMAQLTIGPALLLGLTVAPTWIRAATRWRKGEAALLATGLLVVGVAVFDGRIRWEPANPVLLFALLPFLLWAAVRFSVSGTSLSLLGVTVLATWGAIRGRGPFSIFSPADDVISLQLFLIGISAPMVFLAAFIRDREETKVALRVSEDRYRDLVESQTELICRYLPDTTLTFVNQAFSRSYGRPQEALVGTKFLHLMDQGAREHHLQYIAALLSHPHSSVDEHEVLLPDGSIGWQQWVDHAICDAHGQVVEIQSVGRDITERRRAELALRESEERYRVVAHNFPRGAVLLFGEDLRHLFVDGQGLPELGLSKAAAEGKTIWEAFPDDLAAALAPRYEAALSGEHAAFDLDYASHAYQMQILPIHSASRMAGMAVIQDVTEQRRARDELERERTQAAYFSALSQEFGTLLDHSPDAIMRFDRALRLRYVNPRAETALGILVREGLGKTYAELGFPGSVYRPWEQALREVIAAGEPQAFDSAVSAPDGQERVLHVRYIPEFAPDGSVESVLGIMSDITDLRHAEARVAEQASQLEAIFEAQVDAVAVYDLQGRFVRANTALHRIFGLAADNKYTTRSLTERAERLLHFNEQGRLLAAEQWPLWRVLRGEILAGASAMDVRIRALDGREVWTSITGAPIRAREGQTTGAVLVTRDVSARRELEHRLQEHIAQEATEAERARLARELHDTVTQELYSASLIADALPRIWDQRRGEAERALVQLQEITRSGLATLRILLVELRPDGLEGMTLPAVLRQLLDAMRTRAGVPLNLDIVGDEGGWRALPQGVKQAFYRMAQEAVTNAVKYAAPSQITVRLRRGRRGSLHMEIADDGVGFDPHRSTAEGHFGLAIMRERAQAIGAAMHVRSQEGQGTRVVIHWQGTAREPTEPSEPSEPSAVAVEQRKQ